MPYRPKSFLAINNSHHQHKFSKEEPFVESFSFYSSNQPTSRVLVNTPNDMPWCYFSSSSQSLLYHRMQEPLRIRRIQKMSGSARPVQESSQASLDRFQNSILVRARSCTQRKTSKGHLLFLWDNQSGNKSREK